MMTGSCPMVTIQQATHKIWYDIAVKQAISDNPHYWLNNADRMQPNAPYGTNFNQSRIGRNLFFCGEGHVPHAARSSIQYGSPF